MTTGQRGLILGGLAALALTFFVGRWTKRQDTREVTKVVYQDKVRDVVHETVREVKVAEIRTQWKTRTVTTPGGVTTVYAEVEQGAKTSDASDATKDKARERVVNNTTERTVTITMPTKSWLIQTHGGVTWAGERFFGGSLAKTLIGPFGAGIFADTRGAGLVISGQF